MGLQSLVIAFWPGTGRLHDYHLAGMLILLRVCQLRGFSTCYIIACDTAIDFNARISYQLASIPFLLGPRCLWAVRQAQRAGESVVGFGDAAFPVKGGGV